MIASNELSHIFGENNIVLGDQPRIVEIIDSDEDGTIDRKEWAAALKPRRPCRGADPASPYLTVEQKNLFQRAWLEQLSLTLGVIKQVDTEVNQKRDQLQLNGERIFNDMDRHNLGYISINNFANWVADNCGYQIADEDLPALETSLDGLNDYRITKDAFIETVSVQPEEEEEDGERRLLVEPHHEVHVAPKMKSVLPPSDLSRIVKMEADKLPDYTKQQP